MKYDVEFINPKGNPGTFYALEASNPEEAKEQTPYWLAASSQWRPDQFQITSVTESINNENE